MNLMPRFTAQSSFGGLSKLPRRMKRIPGKIKSSFLRLPVMKSITQLHYQRRLAAFIDSTPRLCASGANLVALVNREGAILTSIEKLPFCPDTSLLTSIDRLLPELQTNNRIQENSIRLSQDKLIKHPDIYVWGLGERLLDVVENYLGLPAFYHRVEVRRDLVNKDYPTSASQWHRDVVDYRMFKLIIYFNDVRADGGPFEFISKPMTLSASRVLKYHSGYVSDAAMESAAPRDHWQLCTGPLGSVIAGDTASVFHRIRAPVNGHRLSITFTYTSRKPIRVYDRVPFSRQDISDISKHLTERQLRCLFLD